ncbi:MAG TPA: MFS transporter [Aliidongia sp.]|nr:MFS transporter [Aliidongia sp.]
MPYSAADRGTEAAGISGAVTLLLACSCGFVVCGIYFAQPLIGLIGPDLGLAPWARSLIVTVSQLGFCLGLLFLAPLGDLVENRLLILATIGGAVLAHAAAALAPGGTVFLIASCFIGVTSTAVQMLVPLAAHLSLPERRGRVVGNVMSGLLLGILLARPLSSLIAGRFGWRAVFGGEAVLLVVLVAVLSVALPSRRSAHVQRYGALIASLWTLLRATPELRRRAGGQAFLFAAFSLFWTAVPLELAVNHGFSQDGIALFALVGAGGALCAPVVGRLADRGFSRQASLAGICAVGLSFAAAGLYDRLWLLALAGVVLDAGVQANHVVAQRAVLAINPSAASRLNSLYIAIFFLGGAFGSAIAGSLFLMGWGAVSAAGTLVAVGALTIWLRSPR